MLRVRIFTASFNPMYYDPKEIAGMDFDKAKSFFADDKIGCACVIEHTLDLKNPNEFKIMQDGLTGGDTTDAFISWIKVD
jgi:hypothetical protein